MLEKSPGRGRQVQGPDSLTGRPSLRRMEETDKTWNRSPGLIEVAGCLEKQNTIV